MVNKSLQRGWTVTRCEEDGGGWLGGLDGFLISVFYSFFSVFFLPSRNHKQNGSIGP
jgi:hypothetical protein